MPAADIGGGTVVHYAVIGLETAHALQVIDLTPLVAAAVRRCGTWDGLVTVQTQHTTTGLLVNEHEPLFEDDLLAMLTRLVPGECAYAHDDLARRAGVPPGERINGAAHCRAALLRASETLPVSAGTLALGRWQRVLFVECDGGRRRRVSVVCLGRRAGA
jgi:secondary thiamine-phosphate synthase enzyme